MAEPFYGIYRIYTSTSEMCPDILEEISTADNYTHALELVLFYSQKNGRSDAVYELHKRDITSPVDKGIVVYTNTILSCKGKKTL